MTDAAQSSSTGSANALVAKWRAEAKRHETAAQEPNMDAQEYMLHDEAHRVYAKCADDLASTFTAAQGQPSCGDPASIRAAAIEECAAMMRRWAADAKDFPNDRLCVAMSNTCQNSSIAISNLAKRAPAVPSTPRESPDHEPGCQSGDFGPCDCSLSSTNDRSGT